MPFAVSQIRWKLRWLLSYQINRLSHVKRGVTLGGVLTTNGKKHNGKKVIIYFVRYPCSVTVFLFYYFSPFTVPIDDNYCDSVRQVPPYSEGRRLPDVIDMSIFDFINVQIIQKIDKIDKKNRSIYSKKNKIYQINYLINLFLIYFWYISIKSTYVQSISTF